MKKQLIIGLCILVGLLAISYHKAKQQEQAKNLITAAYEGDIIAVKDLLAQGASSSAILYFNDKARHYENMDFNLLQAAASSGNEKLISYLLEKPDHLNQVNHLNWTALYVAIRDGHSETAARLIQAGAQVNVQTDTGATALLMAMLADFPTEQERYMLTEYLLKRNADPNLQTQWGTDALFYAVTERKDKNLIELLIRHQADVCRQYDKKFLPDLADKSLHSFLQNIYKKQCK